MNIQGLQKLTLLDYPGKVACTIFAAPCNLRCPFCHNASLVWGINPQLPWPTVKDFLSKRVGTLDGVCLTGGEPTIQKSLHSSLREIKELGFKVKLDTNGTKPQVLRELVTEGLVDYVALDVKNSMVRYAETVGVAGFDCNPIRTSIEFLLSGAVDYEFRTTLVREFHSKASLLEVAQLLQGAKRYFLQSFQASEDVLQKGLESFTPGELVELLQVVKPLVPTAELRGI